MKVFDDTIVGISTSQSPGAISIIRVSGESFRNCQSSF